METIEERIGLCNHCLTDTTRRCHSDCHYYSKYLSATEQQKIDIAKACKWVDDNVGTLTAIALRKAMEE